MEEGPEQIKTRVGRTPFSRFAIVGCSVVTVVVFILVGIALYALSRSPYYRGIAECRSRIERVGGALDRYSIKNDTYPTSLKDLVPDYLPAKTLYCPVGNSIYTYSKPRMDAPPDTVMLTCERHRLMGTGPVARIQCLKNGKAVLSTPKGGR